MNQKFYNYHINNTDVNFTQYNWRQLVMIEKNNSFQEMFKQKTAKDYQKCYSNIQKIIKNQHKIGFLSQDQKTQKLVLIKYTKNKQEMESQINIINKLRNLKQSYYFANYIDAFSAAQTPKTPIAYLLVFSTYDSTLQQIFAKPEQLNKLQRKQKLIFFKQLSKAIQVMHNNNIIHRGIDPQDIFIIKGKQQLMPIIAGFEQAKKFNEYQNIYMTKIKYKTLYTNPQWQHSTDYGFQVDIFPLGLILYQLFSQGHTPFDFKGTKYGQNKYKKIRKETIQALPKSLQNNKLIQPQQKQLIIKMIQGQITSSQIVQQLQNIIYNIDNKLQITTSDNTNEQQLCQITQSNQELSHISIYKSLNSSSNKWNQPSHAHNQHNNSSQKSSSSIQFTPNQQLPPCQCTPLPQLKSALSLIQQINKRKKFNIQTLAQLQTLKSIQLRTKTYRIIQNQKIQQQDKTILLFLCFQYTMICLQFWQTQTHSTLVKDQYLQFIKKITPQYKKLKQRLPSYRRKSYEQLLKQQLPLPQMHKKIKADYQHVVYNAQGLTQKIICLLNQP